ncbi:hypothetical protein [Dyella tabacisoli]|uniref:Uncharacterized protein n=1 Tax=Dyella tabacisoli TaxID=2282381 RepID=A0A369UVB1_9GAMM|nr:hypothetical protein [Dyella tabacisoli]RDD83540.1 hypothetical protein DVJ77_02900 [Dyella tabacisoli]
MVIFALTKHGLSEMFDLARGSKTAIWVNRGLLDELEMKELRTEGFDLTDFVHWIDPVDESAVEEATATIREHHPDQVLYIELV